MIHAQMVRDLPPLIKEWDGTPLCSVQLCWQHDDIDTGHFVRRIWYVPTHRDRSMSLLLDGREA
jgi:hypothetical protein